MKRSALTALLFALAFTFVCPPKLVQAQDPYHCIDDLSDDDVKYRIKLIKKNFAENAQSSRLWRSLWSIILLGAGAGFTYAAIDASDDWDIFGYWYLAAGAYAQGLSPLVWPMPDVWGHKRIKRKPDETEEQRKAQLRYATKTLEQAASVQDFLGGAAPVALGLVYGVVGGSVKAAKWTGETKGLTAALFVVPPIVNGLFVATAPKHSSAYWETYRSIGCSSHYYDQGPTGPEFDLSALSTGRLRLTF